MFQPNIKKLNNSGTGKVAAKNGKKLKKTPKTSSASSVTKNPSKDDIEVQQNVNKKSSATSLTEVEEIVVWKNGYFGLTQNIDEKRGPKYKCTECSSFYNTRLSFLTHSKIHLKPFCILCGTYEDSEDEMANHKINNHRQFIEIVKQAVDKIYDIEKTESSRNVLVVASPPKFENSSSKKNVEIVYSVFSAQKDKSPKNAVTSQPEPSSPNGKLLSRNENLLTLNSTPFELISNSKVLEYTPSTPSTPTEYDNEFIQENKNKEMENSSILTDLDITKEPPRSLRRNKLKNKLKNYDESVSTSVTPRTKYSRSGRCITMKTFHY